MTGGESIAKFHPVHPALHGVVDHYIIWRRTADYSKSMIVLPNNIGGFGFTLQGNFYVKENGVSRLMPVSGTRNTMDLPREVYTTGDFINISVRMKMPQGMHRFTRVPAHELFTDLSFDLRDLFYEREMESLVNRLQETADDNEKISVIEQFLVQKLHPLESQFYNAVVDAVHEYSGLLTIRDLAARFSVSERSVHRLFMHHAGISPKAYISLVRFRSVIGSSEQPLFKPLHAAFDSGFYDQSHFIKLFNRLSSITPGKYFSDRRPEHLSDFYNF